MRAERNILKFRVDKSSLKMPKMPKMVHLVSFLKPEAFYQKVFKSTRPVTLVKKVEMRHFE